MLAGLEEVSEGEIRIAGADVSKKPPKDRDIAMVFQNYALYPHMTVGDNMGFALQHRLGTTTLYGQRSRCDMYCPPGSSSGSTTPIRSCISPEAAGTRSPTSGRPRWTCRPEPSG
jgi:hypothetical protein